jgi:hypothetical protein
LERADALRDWAQLQTGRLNMGFVLTVQRDYEALSRQYIPAVLDLVAVGVDWDFIGSANLPYSGGSKAEKRLQTFSLQ